MTVWNHDLLIIPQLTRDPVVLPLEPSLLSTILQAQSNSLLIAIDFGRINMPTTFQYQSQRQTATPASYLLADICATYLYPTCSAAETTSDVFSPLRFQVPKPLSGMSLRPEEEGDRRGCCSKRAEQLLMNVRRKREAFIFGLVNVSDWMEQARGAVQCIGRSVVAKEVALETRGTLG